MNTIPTKKYKINYCTLSLVINNSLAIISILFGYFNGLDAIVKYLGAINGHNSINYYNGIFLMLYFFTKLKKHSLVYK